jgi:hypothetical protein
MPSPSPQPCLLRAVLLVLLWDVASGGPSSGAGCASQRGANVDATLLIRGAVSSTDIQHMLAAQQAAWEDPFLAEHYLVNHTRQISGVQQSVTWLHRHHGEAGNVIGNVVLAALEAEENAGWSIAEQLGPLNIRCTESIHYEVTDDQQGHEGNEQQMKEGQGGWKQHQSGWHQDEGSVLTIVLAISSTPDIEGGTLEIDRGGGPQRVVPLQSGDMVIFRSWDAHRSNVVQRGERHIVVIELWSGPLTAAHSVVGRPDLEGGQTGLCSRAVVVDPGSAALLWSCSKESSANAAQLLEGAAGLVSDSAFLWEMSAAANAISLLDELRAGVEVPSLSDLASALHRASELRIKALVPSRMAQVPIDWEEEEDGVWAPPLVDSGDGASLGGFFQKISRAKDCGFPAAEGLPLLRRMLAARGISETRLAAAVLDHPVLDSAW